MPHRPTVQPTDPTDQASKPYRAVPSVQPNTTPVRGLTQTLDMAEEAAQLKFQGNPSFVITSHAELHALRTRRISQRKPAQASPRTSKHSHSENDIRPADFLCQRICAIPNRLGIRPRRFQVWDL